MRTCLFILLNVLFFIGCEKEKAELFTDTRYIKFRFYNDLGDDYYKITYSFAYEPDEVQEKELRVPVEFRGYSLTEGLTYSVAVDTGTTLPKDCFKLEENQVFSANSGAVDSLKVTLLRNEILQETSKLLRLKLVSNDNFETYMKDSLFVEITVDDIFTKPAWWDDAIKEAYLGKYSALKYQEFIAETGITDFGILDASEKRHYALVFKRALEKSPRLDEDGKPMTVTVTG